NKSRKRKFRKVPIRINMSEDFLSEDVVTGVEPYAIELVDSRDSGRHTGNVGFDRSYTKVLPGSGNHQHCNLPGILERLDHVRQMHVCKRVGIINQEGVFAL